jgi:hypothetical protein
MHTSFLQHPNADEQLQQHIILQKPAIVWEHNQHARATAQLLKGTSTMLFAGSKLLLPAETINSAACRHVCCSRLQERCMCLQE